MLDQEHRLEFWWFDNSGNAQYTLQFVGWLIVDGAAAWEVSRRTAQRFITLNEAKAWNEARKSNEADPDHVQDAMELYEAKETMQVKEAEEARGRDYVRYFVFVTRNDRYFVVYRYDGGGQPPRMRVYRTLDEMRRDDEFTPPTIWARTVAALEGFEFGWNPEIQTDDEGLVKRPGEGEPRWRDIIDLRTGKLNF